MKTFFGSLVMLVLSLNIWACTNSQPNNELNVERSNVISATATVEAIDMKTRMVTLRDTEGNIRKVHASEKVANLPQVRVGDKVTLDYIQSLAVRMAEPGEVKKQAVGMIEAAKPGSKPGVFGAAEITVSATIIDIDKVNETAALKGPDGEVIVVKVQDPANLNKVKVGDTIIITYTEALALSIKGSTE